MKAFWNHYCIRMKATFRAPYALAMLLFSAAATLLYWPGLIAPSSLEGALISDEAGISEGLLTLLWVFMWPMLAGALAGGSVAGASRESLAVRAMPALPVSLRTRAMAETVLILTFVFLVRIPSFIFGKSVHQAIYLPGLLNQGGAELGAFAQRSFYGAMIMLPSILLWTAPARSMPLYFLVRPFALLVLLIFAMKLGLLATPLACVITCAALTILVLQGLRWRLRLPAMAGGRQGTATQRWRRGRDPEVQLRRDLWLRPLPALVFFAILQLLCMVFDGIVGFPRLGLYFSTSLIMGFALSFVAFRPLGLNLFDSGVGWATSLPGSSRAWQILPLRREAVLRGIYLYGWVIGLLLWAGVVGVALFSEWLSTGVFRLVDMDGDPAGRLILPYIALVPCLAGAVTCAAAGDLVRGFVSAGAGITIMMSHILLLVLHTSPLIHGGILVFLALLGGATPLVLLRKGRFPLCRGSS